MFEIQQLGVAGVACAAGDDYSQDQYAPLSNREWNQNSLTIHDLSIDGAFLYALAQSLLHRLSTRPFQSRNHQDNNGNFRFSSC